MTPAQRYAEGLANFRANERAKRYREMRRSWKRMDAGRSADRFADPAGGLTYFERRQLATRRPFGARPR